jgi:hypothetical protein
VSGHWVELDHAWHETNVAHCPVCGTLTPRRLWRFEGGEGEIGVCSPECEELYEGYWKPAYGVLKPV